MTTTPSWLTGLQQDANQGYMNPETGEWISQSSGGYIDPNNPDMQYGLHNSSGGISDDLYRAMGLDPNETYYTAGNGGINGTGQAGDLYSILNSQGEDTGIQNAYSTTTSSDMAKLAATYMAILGSAGMAGAALAGGAGGVSAGMAGATNPVMSGLSSTGAISSATPGLVGAAGGAAGAAGGQLTGAALDGALAEASSTAMNAYGGSSAAAASQVAGVLEMGGTLTAADLSAFGSAAGLTGTELSTFVAEQAAQHGISTAAAGAGAGSGAGGSTVAKTLAEKVAAAAGSGLSLSDIAGVAGGAWNMNRQENSSDDMLNFLKERMAINDNMYKPGSDEYNALWDQMSRKDAAAGRNSQYGPRSVDLAARVAQLKMDANTKMTTGIADVYANSLNKYANAPASLLANLGNSDFLDNIKLSDIIDWINDFFD